MWQPPEQKPTFYQLRLAHGVSLLKLAQASNRHPFVIWDILLGREVELADAIQVLGAFNELCGTHYTLEQIKLPYKQTNDPASS
ncbi:hypothetical protein EPA93_27685 [Ktedonosporobacter rubrisoli]|uniref:XRE family transcriptional regulator n=1 Tax=Ktedonosporobacter rubrisoli TaxID=2509675 RepID=A0A4P6JVJ3_KTERU|nr:hypothetical protein [Ktedonosporobacter rubrisoli]QBD79554.1 hypothetical protein EPA93_27685 [Ktedonosporobacter rubrisoli]